MIPRKRGTEAQLLHFPHRVSVRRLERCVARAINNLVEQIEQEQGPVRIECQGAAHLPSADGFALLLTVCWHRAEEKTRQHRDVPRPAPWAPFDPEWN